MIRIIDGQIFESKPSADRWAVTVHHLGNGQSEACIQRVVEWEHTGALDPDSINAQVLRGEREDPDQVHKDEANRKRAARRAKTKVRRLCKAFGLDTMFTLTYRENIGDLVKAKADVKAFVRRVKAYIPEFRYVACYERQERGAWHVHMAVKAIARRFVYKGCKMLSYDVLRSIWHAVIGLNMGACNVADEKTKARNQRRKRRSPARLAAYMSKYMLKDFEEAGEHVNRYSSSLQGEVPASVRMEFTKATLAELVPLIYAEIAVDGTELFTWLSKWGDVFYIASEPRIEHALRAWET